MTSIPLEHRIACSGFLFKEKPTLPHIRRDMIDFYKIPISQINNIKQGANWITEEGEIIPNNRLVTLANTPRCYAYCSDTRYIPHLYKVVKGANILYHEATYDKQHESKARLFYHSTAQQAAKVAEKAKVGKLLLGHYSARYEDENILLEEAKAVFPDSILASEGLVIDV